ncbi:hypothetical protein ACI0FS_16990, partial [Ochrobactrum quorumnocens]|uniref:hypothetical protein n=1 Tax=Ochrobactrum quorumnocens TaxID=271865 RepID=UPI003855081E
KYRQAGSNVWPRHFASLLNVQSRAKKQVQRSERLHRIYSLGRECLPLKEQRGTAGKERPEVGYSSAKAEG